MARRLAALLAGFAAAGEAPTGEAALQALLARHREYARKPQLALRKAVVVALERARGRMSAVRSAEEALPPPPTTSTDGGVLALCWGAHHRR